MTTSVSANAEWLERAAEQAGVPVAVIGEGRLAAVHFTGRPVRAYADVFSADRALLTRTNTGLLRRSILAQLATKFYVSLVHADADLDATATAFGEALAEAAGRSWPDSGDAMIAGWQDRRWDRRPGTTAVSGDDHLLTRVEAALDPGQAAGRGRVAQDRPHASSVGIAGE